MNHTEEYEELTAYIDGELTAADANRVAAHLAQCDRCRDMEAGLRTVSARLGEWQVTVPENGPAASKMARSVSYRHWLAVAATVILAVGGATAWVLRTSRGQTDELGVRARQALSPAAAGKLDSSQEVATAAQSRAQAGPMMVRTARLSLLTGTFDAARASVEAAIRAADGYPGRIQVTGTREQGRTLSAVFHVPSSRLDQVAAAIKSLGGITSEALDGEDVTQQSVDLDARLSNARASERRLKDILDTRTGDVSGVLSVEREIARVRGEIERMEAERKRLDQRLAYARLEVQITEQKAASVDLGSQRLSQRFRDAFVRGWAGVVETAVETALVGTRLLPGAVVLMLIAAPVLALARRQRGPRAGAVSGVHQRRR